MIIKRCGNCQHYDSEKSKCLLDPPTVLALGNIMKSANPTVSANHRCGKFLPTREAMAKEQKRINMYRLASDRIGSEEDEERERDWLEERQAENDYRHGF